MKKLKVLQVTWQRFATRKEMRADDKRSSDDRRLTGRGDNRLVSVRDLENVDIACGPEYDTKELMRRLIFRILTAHLEDDYEFYYVTAFFDIDGVEYARTIMPRTEISPRLREAAHRHRSGS